VFGIAGPFIRTYHPNLQDSDPANLPYTINTDAQEDDDEVITSNLGTPVHFPMAFVGGTYYTMNNGIIEQTTRDGMWLPYTSVAGFYRAKRCTITPMSGYEGAVIEQYGFEPWRIKVQGFIIREGDSKLQSVDEQVRELESYEALADSIKVRGRVFERLKISQVYIEDIDYPPARNLNAKQIQPYEMKLTSVKPIQLILP
jgi:hypothetical protein